MSIRGDIQELVLLGFEYHSTTTQTALRALSGCRSYDQLEAEAQKLPFKCRAMAKRILREAKNNGVSRMMVLNHIDEAQTHANEIVDEIYGIPVTRAQARQAGFMHKPSTNNPEDFEDLIDFSR